MTASDLQIASFQPIALTAPYTRPDTHAGHKANGWRNCVWLRMEAADGTVGWGEAYWGAYATRATMAALERCAPYVVGATALDPVALMSSVRARSRYWAMRGLGAQAQSAIEAAAWDIYAKVLGVPMWSALGGQTTGPVQLYASAGDDSLGPAEIYDQARRYRDSGYRAYKLRCGGRFDDDAHHSLDRDVERVGSARAALGPDAILAVDVTVPQRSVAWPIDRAAEYAQALSPFDLAFLEEPAPTYDVAAYAGLRSIRVVPIAGGESFTTPDEFEPFFAGQALDVAQPDASVVGGPASAVAVGRRAAEHGVKVSMHAWSAGIGLAQNLHAAFALENVTLLEWPQAKHPLADDPISPLLGREPGSIDSPSAPGSGVRISDELLERYAYRPGYERDF